MQIEATIPFRSSLLTLNGNSYPFVALVVLLIGVLYQLISGNLLKLGNGTITRRDRPENVP